MSKYDITLERCVTLSHHFWAVCVWIFAPAFVWCHLSFNDRWCVLPPERPKSYGHAECCRALRKMKTAACAMGHLLYTHRHATRCIIYIRIPFAANYAEQISACVPPPEACAVQILKSYLSGARTWRPVDNGIACANRLFALSFGNLRAALMLFAPPRNNLTR